MGSVFPDRCWEGWGRVGEGRGGEAPHTRTARKHTFASNTAPIYKVVVVVPGQLLEPDGDLHPMSPTLVLPQLL